MRAFIPALIFAMIALPAAAQEDGIFVFDFSSGNEAERAALARQVIDDAEGIADAAVILCSTTTYDYGREQRLAVTEDLENAGAARERILDAGRCTPQVTGRSNDAWGDDRVWLALSNTRFLAEFRQQQLGL